MRDTTGLEMNPVGWDSNRGSCVHEDAVLTVVYGERVLSGATVFTSEIRWTDARPASVGMERIIPNLDKSLSRRYERL